MQKEKLKQGSNKWKGVWCYFREFNWKSQDVVTHDMIGFGQNILRKLKSNDSDVVLGSFVMISWNPITDGLIRKDPQYPPHLRSPSLSSSFHSFILSFSFALLGYWSKNNTLTWGGVKDWSLDMYVKLACQNHLYIFWSYPLMSGPNVISWSDI